MIAVSTYVWIVGKITPIENISTVEEGKKQTFYSWAKAHHSYRRSRRRQYQQKIVRERRTDRFWAFFYTMWSEETKNTTTSRPNFKI
jgi:hypothetical protein